MLQLYRVLQYSTVQYSCRFLAKKNRESKHLFQKQSSSLLGKSTTEPGTACNHLGKWTTATTATAFGYTTATRKEIFSCSRNSEAANGSLSHLTRWGQAQVWGQGIESWLYPNHMHIYEISETLHVLTWVWVEAYSIQIITFHFLFLI